MKVSEILKSKGAEVVTVTARTSVRELVSLLKQHNIGAVVVSDEAAGVTGIVSERDVVRHLASGPQILDDEVSAIMTTDVATVDDDRSVHEIAALMTERRIRHLPVVNDGALVGIISIGDVVKSRIDELQFERDQLESYIS